ATPATDSARARSERPEEIGAEPKLAGKLAQLSIQRPRSSQIGRGLGRQLRWARRCKGQQEAKGGRDGASHIYVPTMGRVTLLRQSDSGDGAMCYLAAHSRHFSECQP